MSKKTILVLCVMIATAMMLSGLYVTPSFESESPVGASIQAADPPHNVTHFLHTGELAKYFSPQFSVLNYFNTELPYNMTGTGRNYTGYEQFAMQWYMSPAVACNLTVVGVDAIIWITGEVGTGQPNMGGSLEIYEVTEQDIDALAFNGTLVSLQNIPSNTPLYTYPPAAPMAYPMNFTHTFAPNSTIRFVLTVNPGTSGGGVGSQYTNVTVFWDSYHMFDSRLIFKTQNPLTIDTVGTRNYMDEVTNGFLEVANTSMTFFANISDPYGGYDIRWVNLTARSPNGTVLPGLDNVPMTRTSGNDISALCEYEVEWNYSGWSTGIYSYDVWAVDNSGHTFYYYFSQFTFVPYDELVTGTFAIGLVYNLAAHLNDSMGMPLIGAAASYTGAPTVLSNETGWANMIVFGNGTLDIYWRGVLVNTTVVNLTADSTIYLNCSVYYPELIFVDSLGVPLPSVAGFFTYPDGDALPVRVSDIAGSIGVIDQVPVGPNLVSGWWRGELVHNDTVNVTADGPLEVYCEVYYMTVTVTDGSGAPIPMCTLAWLANDTQILVDSMFTNATGTAVARLPVGVYDIDIYWHGNEIGEEDGIVLDANMQLTVIGNVCSVNILAIDSRGVAIEEAQIIVMSDTDVITSQMTNESGTIHAILPVGTLRIDTYWLGNLVNSTTVTLAGDSNVIVRCTVSYLDVYATDADGNAMDGVEIAVKDAAGNTIGYGLTVGGKIGFRLPDQTVTVEGHYTTEYMMTHVFVTDSSTVDVIGEAQTTLSFEYPPGMMATVLFSLSMLGLLAAVFAVVAVLLFVKLRKRGGAAESAPAEPAQPEQKPADEKVPPPFN